MTIKILLSGDGGQGIQTIADIICQTAFKKGLNASMVANYGLEQRGGVSLSFIQLSDKEIVYAKFAQADLVLIMSDQAHERVKKHINKKTKILRVADFSEEIKQKNIKTHNLNIFFLGKLTELLEKKKIILRADVETQLKQKLSHKSGWEEIQKTFVSVFK